MLELLAAATVALSPAPPPTLHRPPAVRVFERRTTPRLCKGAGRLQTSGPEPALLYRKDRDEARIRKLIEMPMGEMCRLGGLDAPQ